MTKSSRLIACGFMVVCLCLAFSLFESLFILPAHLGHGSLIEREARNPISAMWRRVQNHVAAGLRNFIDKRYGPFLDRAIEWRYLTIATAIGKSEHPAPRRAFPVAASRHKKTCIRRRNSRFACD